MDSKNRKIYLAFFVFLTLSITSGCIDKSSSFETDQAARSTSLSNRTNSPDGTPPIILDLPPTWTLTPIRATITRRPTGTAIPVSTNTSLLPSLTPIPEWTPLPTINPETQNAFMVELLKNNRGCQLPCWWGIEPGKTTWTSARQFLEAFAIIERAEQSNEIANEIHNVWFPIPFSDTTDLASIYVSDGIVTRVWFPYTAGQYRYQLNQVLSVFGIPEHVYIEKITVVKSYLLILNYHHLQFEASYLISTPDEGTPSRFCVYSPGAMIEAWGANESQLHRNGDTKTLEEVSNLDQKTFYQTYLNASNGKCIILLEDRLP
ncbi:MAG: hypothetical protein GYA36_21220 [Veillonellaceae bacterium]|nr:hypothetical protein [Veillonellaceae bacterium]